MNDSLNEALLLYQPGIIWEEQRASHVISFGQYVCYAAAQLSFAV
jgi:hypothetical protein